MDTYANLKTEVAEWLNREGFTTLENKVDTFLGMAQRRIYRECDLHCLETVYTNTTDTPAATTAVGTVSLPSDFLRTKALYIVNGTVSQEVTGGSYFNMLPYSTTTGVPEKYAIVGTDLVMAPMPGTDKTYYLIYYASLEILSGTNPANWFTDNAPELILFAALLEASLFLKDDARASVWQGRYEEVKTALVASDQRADKEYGGMAVQLT